MILKSEKISLRPFAMEDLETLHQWRNEKEIRLLALMHPYPVTKDHDRQWLLEVMNDTTNKNIFFAAEKNDTTELIGYFQLREINIIHRHAFLGILIGNQEMRGHGFGTEIMNLGSEYGFKMLGLKKISLEVLESNESAIKLYYSLGFIQEGKFINHFLFDGQWHNVVRMAKIS